MGMIKYTLILVWFVITNTMITCYKESPAIMAGLAYYEGFRNGFITLGSLWRGHNL
jgi:hypothetical protein